MVWDLPQPVYGYDSVSRFNSSGCYWKNPGHVFHWPNFKQSVMDWIASNHDQHSKRINRPVFVPRVITEEVQTLQPFILDNLLDVSAKCFIPQSEFKARRGIACKGEPDHVMTRNGELVAVVEEKGRLTLSNSDIVGIYDGDGNVHVNSALNQIYHYMSQECVGCEGPPGHETVYVSEGISYRDVNPTILQCFSYFNSKVDTIDLQSPPTSKRSSGANSAVEMTLRNSPTGSPRGNTGGTDSSYERMINQHAQDFDICDF